MQKEADGWRRAAEAYDAMGDLVSPQLGDGFAVGSNEFNRIYGLVQCRVPGGTLEEELLVRGSCGAAGGAGDLVDRVTKQLLAAARMNLSRGCQASEVGGSLGLSAEYLERLKGTVPSLLAIHQGLARRGLLGRFTSDAAALARFVDFSLESWNSAIRDDPFRRVPTYEQHGDLNPRNVIMAQDGRPRLIDFARYERWPLAFDFTRLEAQLFYRLVDTDDVGDVWPERFASWLDAWREPGKWVGDNGQLGTWASAAVRLRIARAELIEMVNGRSAELDGRCTVGLCMVSDALKMATYQEASWFKRLLFLIVAMEGAVETGIWSV